MKVKLVRRKNPQDKTKEKVYGNAVNMGRKTLRDIARDIAGRSSLTRGDIENVLSNFVDRLPSYMNDGFSIQLGEFGTLRISLSSKGAATEKVFDTAGIKPRVIFTPSVQLKHEMLDISYEVVKPEEEKKKKKP